jgi:hypothetical protein
MNAPLYLSTCSLLVFLITAAPVTAAEIVSENFDAMELAKFEQVNGSGATVTFVDYSNMTVGATPHSIPEAPRPVPGGLPTRGVLLKVDHSATFSDRIANLAVLDNVGGTRLNLTDNYRLKFDVYLRLSPDVTLNATGVPVEAGTTEHLVWGVGYNSLLPIGRSWRSTRGSGVWGWLATEGGHGAANGADAPLWIDTTLSAGRNMDTVNAPLDVASYFAPAFGADAVPVPNCPANQWVEADITVRGGQVTVEFGAVGRTKTKFFENVTGPVGGTVMVGYEDAYSSVSFDQDDQWMLLDNLVVEDLTPATLVVTPSVAAPLRTFTGAPVTAAWEVLNNRTAGDLTISAVNFGGPNATDFSLLTPLPLVLGPGSIGQLEVSFNPAPPNGMKAATLTIVSDDPGTPSYTLGDLRARRSVSSFLHAHYRLDETSGTALADASGAGPNALLNVREAVAYGQPSILGAADQGTSIGFLPAQTSASGNYFTSGVVHTPTFSVSLWIRPVSTGAQRTLFQRDYDSLFPYDKLCGLHLLDNGTLAWRVRSTTIIPGINDPPLPPLDNGAAHHVVLTHLDTDGFGNDTAQRSRIYVNGLLIAEKAGGEARGFDDYPMNPVVATLHVATRTIAGFGYSGDMDDFQIYGVELSREQVWEVFKRPGATAAADWAILNAARGDGTFTVTFPSSPQGNYQLFRSPDLTNWNPAGESLSGAPDALTTTLADPAPPAGLQYYRVRRE